MKNKKSFKNVKSMLLFFKTFSFFIIDFAVTCYLFRINADKFDLMISMKSSKY